MQRLIISAVLLFAASWAGAQTVQITTPSGTCTYSTGPVKNNPNVPGQLLATATGAGTGAGCTQNTSGGPSFGPASPVAPSSVSLNSTGGPANFSFTAVNATQCTAAISGTATGTVTTGGGTICSGTCSGPQTVVTNFNANTSATNSLSGTVTVTCTNGAQQAVSTAAVTIAPQGQQAPGCTNPIAVPNSAGGTFTQWTGQQSVNILGGNQRLADVASFDSMFGTWPGQQGVIVYPTLPTNKYIAASFKSSNNFITNAPANQYGEYYTTETDHSVAISMTISTSCGDFSDPSTHAGSSVVAGCYANQLATSSFLAWTKSSTCKLQDGVQYYLNIINADISNVGPNGTGTATSTYNSSNRFCSTQGCVAPIEIILP